MNWTDILANVLLIVPAILLGVLVIVGGLKR